MLLPPSYLHNHQPRDPGKARLFLMIWGIAYPLYVVLLYWGWYGTTNQTGFHFFNDFYEWLQMDKAGHFLVNFHSTLLPCYMFAWAGYTIKKSALYGLLLSSTVLVPVEMLDGFSGAWGFSVTDMAANILGGLFAYAQLRGFEKIVFLPKFSFHTTMYALVRPDMFGSGYLQTSLKDYNGQTYWLTIDINSLLGRKILPQWLCLCIGYGAEGLYGGHDNVWTDKEGGVHDFSQVDRYRQFYISFDINFTGLVKNRAWQRILYPVNIFKVPFPALEISEKGLVFHWLYY